MTDDSAASAARTIRVSAAVIRDAAGRLLLVRKRGTTAFMQPGGKPEAGESAAETLVRELDEELGLRVSLDELRALGEYAAAAANEPGHIVVADVFAFDLGVRRPERAAEIVEMRWVGPAEAGGLEVAPLAREYFLTV